MQLFIKEREREKERKKRPLIKALTLTWKSMAIKAWFGYSVHIHVCPSCAFSAFFSFLFFFLDQHLMHYLWDMNNASKYMNSKKRVPNNFSHV